jgi:multiple sugar transport system permease protein
MATLPADVAHYERPRPRVSKRVGQIAYYLMVLVVVAIIFFPIYWMAVTTVQPNRFTLRYPPSLIPRGASLSAFTDLWDNRPIGAWIWHSTLVSLTATVICVVMAILGAYAMTSGRWRGRAAFGVFLLVTQMLPESLIVVPIYRIFTHLPVLGTGWVIDFRDSLLGLSLIDAAFIMPICVWILENLFDTIPREVKEAALVDGAGPIRVLVQIILPLTLPGLVAVGVVAFFYAWNEYLFAPALHRRQRPLPGGPRARPDADPVQLADEQQMAAGLVFAAPPVIFYLLMQRYIVAGITAGAVKG